MLHMSLHMYTILFKAEVGFTHSYHWALKGYRKFGKRALYVQCGKVTICGLDSVHRGLVLGPNSVSEKVGINN